MQRTCFICGDPIPERYHVCGHCRDEWHLEGPVKTWPKWARDLRRMVAREIAGERRAYEYECWLDERLLYGQGPPMRPPMRPAGRVAFGSDGELVPDPGPGAAERGLVLREIRR